MKHALWSGSLGAALALHSASIAQASGNGGLPPKHPKPASVASGTDARTALRALLAAKKAARTGQAQPVPGGSSVTPGSCIKRVNGHLICPGADLRGADLRWADLRGCDLTKARLNDADLTGAKLGGVPCTDADFRGARLFMADISQAKGLDLTGAEIHPFFQTREGEQVGDFRFLATDNGTEPGLPRSLASTPDQALFWLEGSGNHLQRAIPTGCRFKGPNPLDSQMYALATDAKGRLWSFGDQTHGTLEVGEDSKYKYRYRSSMFAQLPNNVMAGTDGSLLLALPQRTIRMSMQGNDTLSETFDHPSGWDLPASAKVAQNRGGTHFLYYAPGSPLLVGPKNGDICWKMELPPGALPNRVAMGAGEELWITLTGVEGVALLDVGTRELTVYPLEVSEQGPREPSALALGPDGTMWFAEGKGGRIGRMDAKGFIEPFFQLPKDMLPEELIAGHDGRLYFTVQGRHLIGSMRAVAPPAATPAEVEASWRVPVYTPRPERKKPSAAARRALAAKRIERAEARVAAEPKEPKAPPEWYRTAPAEAPPPLEGKAEVPTATPPLAAEKLESLAVNLAPRVKQHILGQHGVGMRKDKSQFAPPYSSPEGLEALLAESLGETEIGRIRCAELIFDPYGRFLTHCTRPNVGWHNHYGQLVPTSRFRVVTQWAQDEGGPVQDVVTAYPVSMNN